jgi:hypothetical protein
MCLVDHSIKIMPGSGSSRPATLPHEHLAPSAIGRLDRRPAVVPSEFRSQPAPPRLWSVLAGAQACDLLLQNDYRLWRGLFLGKKPPAERYLLRFAPMLPLDISGNAIARSIDLPDLIVRPGSAGLPAGPVGPAGPRSPLAPPSPFRPLRRACRHHVVRPSLRGAWQSHGLVRRLQPFVEA